MLRDTAGSTHGGGPRAVSVVMVVLFLAAVLGLGTGAAGAVETETFSLTPSPLVVQGHERRTFAFDLEPGDAASDAVRIVNTTDEPRRFRLAGADARTDPATGGVVVDPSHEEPEGVGSWVELERREIEVPPGASEVVPFTIRRPADTTAEGLGAVVAEELLADAEAGGIDVVYRLAILIRLGGDVAGLHVDEPTMEPELGLFPSRSDLSVTLTNETLEPIRASVRFTAGGLTGRYWEVAEEEVRLGVGESRDVAATWDTVPRWGGFFSPAAEVAWEGGSIVRTGSRVLHPPLWLVVLAILLVAVRAVRELRDEEPSVTRRHAGRAHGPQGDSSP